MSENEYILDKKEGEFTLPRISTEAIKDLKTQYDMFRQLQKEVLQGNVDYGFPAGQKEGKPSLYKSGAEKLTRLFNLTPRFELIKVTEEENFVMYTFKCTLQARDFIVGEGYGSCNSKEKRHWSENPLGNANTILKMAKKRAHVDAILTGLGASNVFTQDLEDITEEPANSHAKITEKQLKLVYKLTNDLAKLTESPKEEIMQEIKTKYGVEHANELSKEQASDLIAELQEKINAISN